MSIFTRFLTLSVWLVVAPLGLLFIALLGWGVVTAISWSQAPIEASDPAPPSMPDVPALTWYEWVDLQAPIREAVPPEDR